MTASKSEDKDPFAGAEPVEGHNYIYQRKDGYFCFEAESGQLSGAYFTAAGAEAAFEDYRSNGPDCLVDI